MKQVTTLSTSHDVSERYYYEFYHMGWDTVCYFKSLSTFRWNELASCWLLLWITRQPWRWRQDVPPKVLPSPSWHTRFIIVEMNLIADIPKSSLLERKIFYVPILITCILVRHSIQFDQLYCLLKVWQLTILTIISYMFRHFFISPSSEICDTWHNCHHTHTRHKDPVHCNKDKTRT
jgi:hypothetical protein